MLKNKPTDIQKADQERRVEIGMMYILMEKYPQQAKERIRQPTNEANHKRKTASL